MQISEIGREPNQLAASLGDGLENLDLGQEVTFQAYTRVVLPIDGYVFWQPTVEECFKGSLHFSQEIQQNLDETVGLAYVTFTSRCRIDKFSDAPMEKLYVGCHEGVRFAFSQQAGFYSQASLWHYRGQSILPALASQLLDRPGALDPRRAVASNSLPIWLALKSYAAPFPSAFASKLTLYPADLVPANLTPPYGVIDVQATRWLQPIPRLDKRRGHTQLAADRCQLTLYGLQNDEAVDFMDAVLQYSDFTDNIGIMTPPIIADGKRPQAELQAIAMQKTLDLEVSYYQSRAADIARQLITQAIATVIVARP